MSTAAPSRESTSSPATDTQELVISRLFDAPRELVFRVWTDPKHIAQWWGPEYFTAPAVKIDLREGGKYLYCMRSPEGQDSWSTGVFHEVVESERLVYTDSFADAEGNVVPASYYGMEGEWPLELHVAITFEEVDGRTKVTLRTRGIPAGFMSEMAEAGWNTSLDKVAAELARLSFVTSRDGTTIAYGRSGDGPPVILVTGALGVRYDEGLAEALSTHFTVYNFDRRGRGDSGNVAPYAVEREVEDIEALIDVAGGPAFLYGISSGAVLALEAASRLPGKVRKLALYEPPFVVDDSHPPLPQDYLQRLSEAVTAGRRGDAVALFMTDAIGLPAEFVDQMRVAPMDELFGGEGMTPPEWAAMEKVAHTLPYDGAIMGDTMSGKPLPAGKWSGATMPTLVITGGKSDSFFHSGAQALVGILPDAEHRILEGQDHAVSSEALAPMLEAFFLA